MGKMTHKKFLRALRDGLGQGHGEAYSPWLYIHRKNVSPCSNQVIAAFPGWQRQFHFFSRQEHELALVLIWLGVLDLREQYPAWPWEHPHPLVATTNDLKIYKDSRGMLAIAEEAGIVHGVYPGTNILYPSTIDILITVKGKKNSRQLIGIALKPRKQIEDEITNMRLVERLELQRRYCAELYIPFLVVDSKVYPKQLIANLAWLSGSAILPQHIETAKIIDFIHEFNYINNSLPIRESLKKIRNSTRLNIKDGFDVFFHAVWSSYIDLDLSRPIVMSIPPYMGGESIRHLISDRLVA